MNPQIQAPTPKEISWQWPIDIAKYDRSPLLSEAERSALTSRFSVGSTQQVKKSVKEHLHRLLLPIEDVLTFLRADANTRYDMIRVMLLEMDRRGISFWAWSEEEWVESLCPDATAFALRYGRSCDAGNMDQARRFLPILSYLLQLPPDLDMVLRLFKPYALARRIFGKTAIDDAATQLTTILQSWGYHQKPLDNFKTCVCYLLLRNRHPSFGGLTSELLETITENCAIPSVQHNLYRISRALCALGIIEKALPYGKGAGYPAASGTNGSVSEEWLVFCQRWRNSTTIQQRDGYYYPLLKVGRWLNVSHPEVRSHADWTYELAAEFVAAVSQMKIGEWSDVSQRSRMPPCQVGQPLRPRTKDRLLEAMRTFMCDCQEWDGFQYDSILIGHFRLPPPFAM